MPERREPLGLAYPTGRFIVPWNLPPNRGRNHAHRLRSPRPSGRRERVSVFLALRAGRRSQPAAGGLRRAGPGTRIEAAGREEAPRVLSSDPSRGRVEDPPAGTLDVGHPDGVICDRILPLNRGRYHTPGSSWRGRITYIRLSDLRGRRWPSRRSRRPSGSSSPRSSRTRWRSSSAGAPPPAFAPPLREGGRPFVDGRTRRALVGGTF